MNDKNVSIIELLNGKVIAGKIVNQSSTDYEFHCTVNEPLSLNISIDPSQMDRNTVLQFAPFCPFTESTEINIENHAIVYIVSASEEISERYSKIIQQMNSTLVLPDTGIKSTSGKVIDLSSQNLTKN